MIPVKAIKLPSSINMIINSVEQTKAGLEILHSEQITPKKVLKALVLLITVRSEGDIPTIYDILCGNESWLRSWILYYLPESQWGN